MSNCATCYGLIMEPGISYGYAGKVLNCKSVMYAPESGYTVFLKEPLTPDEEKALREYLLFVRKLSSKPKETTPMNHDNEREAFEANERDIGNNVVRDYSLYKNELMTHRWLGWQARAAAVKPVQCYDCGSDPEALCLACRSETVASTGNTEERDSLTDAMSHLEQIRGAKGLTSYHRDQAMLAIDEYRDQQKTGPSSPVITNMEQQPGATGTRAIAQLTNGEVGILPAPNPSSPLSEQQFGDIIIEHTRFDKGSGSRWLDIPRAFAAIAPHLNHIGEPTTMVDASAEKARVEGLVDNDELRKFAETMVQVTSKHSLLHASAVRLGAELALGREPTPAFIASTAGAVIIDEPCEADSYNIESTIPGMGVSHESLKESFPNARERTKVIWIIQLLQLNAQEALAAFEKGAPNDQ